MRAIVFPTLLFLVAPAAVWAFKEAPPMNLWLLDWQAEQTAADTTPWWNPNWHYRVPVKAPFSYFPRQDVVVHARVDFAQLAQRAGLKAPVDLNSVRVVEATPQGAKEVPSAFLRDRFAAPDDGPDTLLAWVMPGATAPRQERVFHLYFDTTANGRKPAPNYPSAERPPENLLKNADLARRDANGMPEGWRVEAGGMQASQFLSVVSGRGANAPGRLVVSVHPGNRGKLTQDRIAISQRVPVQNPEGKEMLAAARFCLERGGPWGCPVGLHIAQYDASGKEVGQTQHRSFHAAEGQRPTAVLPFALEPNAAEVEFRVQVWPALVRDIPGRGREMVSRPEGDLRLSITDLVLRYNNEVPLEQRVPRYYVEGIVEGGPRQTALLIEGDDTLIFNTFPSIRGYGIGSPVHLDVRRGTLEMWVCPKWNWDDGKPHVLFQSLPAWSARLEGTGESGERPVRLQLVKTDAAGGNRLRFTLRDSAGRDHTAEAEVPFRAGEWLHVAITWDLAAGQMALFANGRRVAAVSEPGPWPAEAVHELMEVGNAYVEGGVPEHSRQTLEGAVDELRISDVVRYTTDFDPPRQEFELDAHTRALFHFEESARGIHAGGDRFVPSMTTFEEPDRQRFLVLERCEPGGRVLATRLNVVPLHPDAAKQRLARYAPPWVDAREKLALRRPDPTRVRTVLRYHEAIIDRPGAQFTIPVGGDYEPVMLRVRVETIGDSSAQGVYLTTTATPDLTAVDRTVRSIVKPGMSDEEKAKAIFGFLTQFLPWWSGLVERGKMPALDPVKILNCYGGAICSLQSQVAQDVWVAAGLSARCVGITHHVPAEVFYDGDWHFMDMTYGLYALKRDNRTVASCDDLMADQFLAERAGRSDGDTVWGTGDTRDWAYHLIYHRSDYAWVPRRQYHVCEAHLLPGMACEYAWHNRGERCLQNADSLLAWTSYGFWSYGNGEMRWTPDLSGRGLRAAKDTAVNTRSVKRRGIWCVEPVDASQPATLTYDVAAPYVIASATISGVAGVQAPQVSVSTDGGKNWTACPVISEASGAFVADASAAVNGVYLYRVKLTLPPQAGVFVQGLEIRTVFQANTPALPGLVRGKNTITFHAKRLRGKVRVRYEWVEQFASDVALETNALEWYPPGQYQCSRVLLAQRGTPLVLSVSASPPKSGKAEMRVESGPGLAIQTQNVALTADPSGHLKGRVVLTPVAEGAPRIHPLRLQVQVGEEVRAYTLGVLAANGGLIVRANDFTEVQGAMARERDPDTQAEVLVARTNGLVPAVARASVEVPADGDYYLWAYVGGGKRRAGQFSLRIDGRRFGLRRQGYEGATISECGYTWLWVRGGKATLTKGRHTLELTPERESSRFGQLVLVRAVDEKETLVFEDLLNNLFLNRNFRPWEAARWWR